MGKKICTKEMVIILIITTLFTMWLYGMAKVYFPDPIYLGAGQYIDIATGIIIIAFFIFGTVLSLKFKSNLDIKKKGK